jgi:hypothetical protein
MGITVLTKADGLWLSFESTTGKSAMLKVSTLLNHGGITNRAIMSTCEELAALKSGAQPPQDDNTPCTPCSCGEPARIHLCNKCFREETKPAPADYNG